MHINCCCCLDLLTPSADISSATCGHIFHTTCIQRWFETSGQSNCPQCRTKCRERDLRRLFFTEAQDTSLNEDDSSELRNKIDSLTFQVLIFIIFKL